MFGVQKVSWCDGNGSDEGTEKSQKLSFGAGGAKEKNG